MSAWLVLYLALILLPLQVLVLGKDSNPRFKFSLRSSLKVPGGSLASEISRGELCASNDSGREDDKAETTDSDESEPRRTDSFIRKKDEPFLKYTKKKGRITIQMSHGSSADRYIEGSNSTATSISASVDPFAAFRLLGVIGFASRHFFAAFVGTLKLLGPLIFARKVLSQAGELVSDYMMGRYLRTTYDRIERKYWKEYQGPAASRSVARCLAHSIALLLLGRLMEWMVGLGYPPCVIHQQSGGYLSCHWWCGLLWIVAVIGAGNLFAALVATRGHLQIKISKSALSKHKRHRIFTHPLKYLSWMKDPDQWLTRIATSRRENTKSSKPFTPEPLLFPSTWLPFSILRNFAVAKAMASSSNIAVHDSMHVIMRQFLITSAMLDEWHRVLINERRVGLGIFAIAIGLIASCFLFVTLAYADGIAAVLMVPSLLAVFSSAWMNLFVFWDRRRDQAADENLLVLQQRRRLGATSYSIKW